MAELVSAYFPTPFTPDEIGGITIAVGLGLPCLAALICYYKNINRAKEISAAWLSYGFTASPLVLLCFNSISSIVHGINIQTTTNAGDQIVAASPLFGAAPATMAFSAGYAILHLTSDLHANITGKIKYSEKIETDDE